MAPITRLFAKTERFLISKFYKNSFSFCLCFSVRVLSGNRLSSVLAGQYCQPSRLVFLLAHSKDFIVSSLNRTAVQSPRRVSEVRRAAAQAAI